jgi:hypothetical protein
MARSADSPRELDDNGHEAIAGTDLDPEDAAANYRLIRRISAMISVLAAVAVAVHLIWPALKIDLVTVALLVFGSLPWLRGIIQSIRPPGGASIEMRDHDSARAALLEKRHTAAAVRTIGTAADTASAGERIRQINAEAHQYEAIRQEMPSGTERTREMGAVARRILSLLPAEGLDVSDALLGPKAGQRLVAYLALIAAPDAAHGEERIQRLPEREGIPYNQSWALRALGLILDRSGSAWVTPRSAAMLAGMRNGLRPGSDRHAMLTELVDQLSRPTGWP